MIEAAIIAGWSHFEALLIWQLFARRVTDVLTNGVAHKVRDLVGEAKAEQARLMNRLIEIGLINEYVGEERTLDLLRTTPLRTVSEVEAVEILSEEVLDLHSTSMLSMMSMINKEDGMEIIPSFKKFTSIDMNPEDLQRENLKRLPSVDDLLSSSFEFVDRSESRPRYDQKVSPDMSRLKRNLQLEILKLAIFIRTAEEKGIKGFFFSKLIQRKNNMNIKSTNFSLSSP